MYAVVCALAWVTNCLLMSAQLTGVIPGNIHLAGVTDIYIYIYIYIYTYIFWCTPGMSVCINTNLRTSSVNVTCLRKGLLCVVQICTISCLPGSVQDKLSIVERHLVHSSWNKTCSQRCLFVCSQRCLFVCSQRCLFVYV